jgi:transposase
MEVMWGRLEGSFLRFPKMLRLCPVEEWVKKHRKILELVTGWSIGEKDASDDRLARVTEELGIQKKACTQIEMKIGKHLIHAYELPTKVARAVCLYSRLQSWCNRNPCSYCIEWWHLLFSSPYDWATPRVTKTMGTQSTSSLAAKPGDDLEQLHRKVEAILKRHRVKEFFSINITTESVTETRYLGRGRPTAKSPQEQVTRINLQLQFPQLSAAIEQAKQLAGWRLYVTNAPTTQPLQKSANVQS